MSSYSLTEFDYLNTFIRKKLFFWLFYMLPINILTSCITQSEIIFFHKMVPKTIQIRIKLNKISETLKFEWQMIYNIT